MSLIQPNYSVLAPSSSGTRVSGMHFESMHNNELQDSSGYGHHGTNHGARLTDDDEGLLFSALEMDGYNDYVDLHKPNLLRLDNTDFTITAWINLDSNTGNDPANTIFFDAGAWGGADNNQMVWFGTNSTGYLKLGFYGPHYLTNYKPPLHEWTHVAVTFDRSAKVARFYVNGTQTPTIPKKPGRPNFDDWTGALLGRAYYSPYECAYLDGMLDEVHVYRRMLNETEVDYIVSQEDTGAGWQYGVSMAPPYTEYQSIEMPTSGMDWTSPPVGVSYYFFVSATTEDGVFAQCGFAYNGRNIFIRLQGGNTSLPPHSWGMFWMYLKPGVGYIGDNILPPSGWSSTHQIYYSIAVYPSEDCLSFLFFNSNRNEEIPIHRTVVVDELFTGRVGGLAESKERSGFGDIYVDRVAVWAQIQIPEQRSCGPGYAYDGNTAPYDADVLSCVRIYKYADLPFVVQVGFYNGTHYSHNTILWSSTYYAGPENFPPECP